MKTIKTTIYSQRALNSYKKEEERLNQNREGFPFWTIVFKDCEDVPQTIILVQASNQEVEKVCSSFGRIKDI